MFIRSVILMTCFAVFISQSASQGEIILAANTILLNFFFLFSYGIDAFAHASEVLVGNSVGEKNITYYDLIIKSSFKFIFFMVSSFLIIFFFFSYEISTLVTSHNNVIDLIDDHIIFLYLIVIFGSVAFCIDGIFIGALQHIIMRNIMIISGITYTASSYVLLSDSSQMIWHSFIIFFATRSILLYLSLRGVRRSLFELKNYV